MSMLSVAAVSVLASIRALFAHPATAVPQAVESIDQAKAGVDTLNAFASLLPPSPTTTKLQEAISNVDALAAKAVVEANTVAPIVEAITASTSSNSGGSASAASGATDPSAPPSEESSSVNSSQSTVP